MSPTGTTSEPQRHSHVSPAFDEAEVVDAMRLGLVSCPPTTPLREVARIMATYRIHCVLVSDVEGHRPWGVISDLDLAAGADADLDKLTAGEVAATEVVTVTPDDTMRVAAQLMAEHDTAHLVVIQRHSGHPVGVLSTLDLAGVLAWGGTA
jgi:CBS domain-containing protein